MNEVKIVGQAANGHLIVELPAPTTTVIWKGEKVEGRSFVSLIVELLEEEEHHD